LLPPQTPDGAAWPARQREKRPGGGAWRQRLGNHLGAGADCPSGVGGLVGGSITVCGPGDLRADLIGFDGLVPSFFDDFTGGPKAAASGNSSADNGRSLGIFSDSTQRKKISLNSPIAAHPARHGTIRTSATRAQARIWIISS